MTRLARVELRKMFDTRAGFWLMASVGIVTVLATAAVILWAPDEAITQNTFSSAIGMPLSVVLPIIAVMSVTEEYSQRTGLTTYTLVPWRGRVLTAKALTTLVVGVVAMFVALAVGALGNVLGSTITGLDAQSGHHAHPVRQHHPGQRARHADGLHARRGLPHLGRPGGLPRLLLVLPIAFGTLAAFQEWFADLQPWVDVQFAITRLFDNTMTAEYWQQLGVTTLVWLWIPLALGLRAVLRAEVK